jgi:precorrin-4/cobalt-precorrin-4 C11-methyltransferase
VVVAHRVTWPDERVVQTTIGRVAEEVRAAGFDATTTVLVGPALAGATEQRSHVYAPDYSTRFRRAEGAERG